MEIYMQQKINYFIASKDVPIGNIEYVTKDMNAQLEKLNLSLDKIIAIIERDNYFIVFYKDYAE